MKKLFAIIACSLFIFALSSCNKEIECECTTTIDGVESGTTTTTIEDKDADCADLESESTLLGITTKVECEEV